MIKQVSWTEYFTVVAILCAIYYVAIILLFFRKELFDLITGKRKLIATAAAPPTSPPHPAENGRTAERSVTEEEKLFGLTNQLMQELQPVFGNEYVKGELVTAIQIILKKYSRLKGTAFQVSVNNYITMESENQCSVSLSEGELRGLWNG